MLELGQFIAVHLYLLFSGNCEAFKIGDEQGGEAMNSPLMNCLVMKRF